MVSEIIIVCDGGCGRTTEGMTWDTREGEFEQVDESGVPKWTCPKCLQLKAIDRFHAHLDVCQQCERHPFDLCAIGAKLLKEAAVGK